jgi:hypothetical protein
LEYLNNSISLPHELNSSRSIQVFKERYLHSDLNVDNVVWKPSLRTSRTDRKAMNSLADEIEELTNSDLDAQDVNHKRLSSDTKIPTKKLKNQG